MKKDRKKLKEIQKLYRERKEDFKYSRMFGELPDDIKDLEQRFEELIRED